MGRPPKGKRRASPDGSFFVAGKASNDRGSLYREQDGTWRASGDGWLDELDRRLAEVESGSVPTIEWDAVKERLLAKYSTG